jgi:hypothetical protein
LFQGYLAEKKTGQKLNILVVKVYSKLFVLKYCWWQQHLKVRIMKKILHSMIPVVRTARFYATA